MNEIEKLVNAFRPSLDAHEGETVCLLKDRHIEIIVAALRGKQQRENQEPLTLEQLQEMNGEPLKHWAWIEILDQDEFHCNTISGYYRTTSDYTNGEAFCCGWPGLGCAYDYCDYGKTWLAYAHKPEEARDAHENS